MKKPASLLGRLVRAQVVWGLAWGFAAIVAIGLAVQHEVDELLDDSLQSAAEVVIAPLVQELAAAAAAAAGAANNVETRRFVWQRVAHDGAARVLNGAVGAPTAALHATPTPGFTDVPGWRVYGMPLGRDVEMLYVAQSRNERNEAQIEVGASLLMAGLPVALLALVWMRARMRHELQPLGALSERLAHYDPMLPGATLGAAAYTELQPVQAAIDALAARLARRVTHERAFTAQAAHALRTPLAGIDAQLAVAVREAPPALQPRLQRVRAAAQRLERVVVALLAMFRSGFEVRRAPLTLAWLVERLPTEGLSLTHAAGQPLHADGELLTAALLNLLDNALRHGATTVALSSPAPDLLRVQDNGRGASPAHRLELQQALDAEDYAVRTGLGLMLADLVARVHGGHLALPATEHGFAVELRLAPI